MKEHNRSLDLIKTFAIFGVILIHTLAEVYFRLPQYSLESNIVLTIDASIRFAVPFFVMVSGALLLDESKKINTKEFYLKKMLPLIIVTLFWFIFYSAYYRIITGTPFFEYFFSFKGTNCPHLWHLVLLIGLYLITPILRLFVKKENKKYIILFICLSVVFQFTVLTIRNFSNVFDVLYETMKFGFATQYVAYYLLGWFLVNFEINKKVKIGFIILGAVSVIITAVGTAGNIDLRNGFSNEEGILTFFYSLGFFLLIYKREPKRKYRVASFIGSRTFGIYVLHMVFMELFLRYIFPFNAEIICPFLYIPILFAFDFVATFATSLIIEQIPYVKKIIWL